MTEIIVAANLNHYKNDQMNRVYSPNGIAPTLLVVSGGGREVKVLVGGDDMTEIKVVGRLSGGPWDKRHDINKRVYNPSGIAPTLTAGGGGGVEPKILVGEGMAWSKDGVYTYNPKKEDGSQTYQQDRVYGVEGVSPAVSAQLGGRMNILVGEDDMQKCFAMRGRYNEDGSTSQQVELRKDDVTSTLTGVQKDNMLLDGGGTGLKQLRINDLFCGAGGMGIGFKQAGFETAGAWDFDKYAVQAYGHNVDPIVKRADITGMNWEDMPQADVWTYGFPCQDLSIAGAGRGLRFTCGECQAEFERKPDDLEWWDSCPNCGGELKPSSRSGLFFEVMRLLDETIQHNPEQLPKIIMAENVKKLAPYLPILKAEYKMRGYKMVYALYNSKFWGLAQNRERYFVIGVHESIEKEFTFPVQQEDYVPRLSAFLDSVVDEKYYIAEEKAAKIIEQAKEGLKVRQATKKGYDIAVEGDSVNLSHPNSKTRRGRVGKQVAQTLLTGQEQVVVEGLKDIHAAMTVDRAEKRQNGRRAKENEKEMYTGNINPSGRGMNGNVIHSLAEQSQTLCARDYKGPSGAQPFTLAMENHYRVRKLTEREYLRLQGFPEDFEIVCSASQTYKQAGNAVSVPVARAIAERVKMFLLSL